jgi:hypothetical protein
MHTVFGRNPEGKRPLGSIRCVCVCEDNIKTELKGIGFWGCGLDSGVSG